METSLNHLPAHKQQELHDIVEQIREYYPNVEMIILFGSYARGDWVEERADDGVHYQYQSDYDLCIVTEKEYTAMKIEQDGILRNNLRQVSRTPISIIAHDIEFMNRRLKKAQYFFTDIKQEGICLYDSGNFWLAEARELTARERQKLAEEDFEYWFNSALDFYDGFKFYLSKNKNNIAAFELHQATERLYSAILLVFTRYKPNTHDLLQLSQMVNSQEPEFLKIFPQGTQEEKRRFELLRKAYVSARYKKSYSITAEELTWLAERVNKLKEVAKKLCEEKIDSYC
jgi:predicted nucleotidyltransferase/HEPN domain-containing protein